MSKPKNPMARCHVCHTVIRKAEVQHRFALLSSSLHKVTVHEKCIGITMTIGGEVRPVSPPMFVATDDLTEIARLLDEHNKAEQKHRHEEAEEAAKQSDDSRAYICRLELETDRHGRGSCHTPGCPVPWWCGHDFRFDDPDEVRYHTVPDNSCSCGRANGKPACYMCNRMWCSG